MRSNILQTILAVVAVGFLIAPQQAQAAFSVAVGVFGGNNISVVNPAGMVSPLVSSVSGPAGLAFDSSGNLYVASQANNAVLEYSTSGAPLGTFANTGSLGVQGIAFDPMGNLYVANQSANSVTEYSPTGILLKTLTAGISQPLGVVSGPTGDVFVSNFSTNSIVEYSPTGALLQTLSGGLNLPAQMVEDGVGNLYVTNEGSGSIEEFSPSGATLGIFPAGTTGAYGLAYDPTAGTLYQSNINTGTIQEFSSNGAALGTLVTGLNQPYLLASTTTVPEPASLGLLSLSTLALFTWRRRVNGCPPPAQNNNPI